MILKNLGKIFFIFIFFLNILMANSSFNLYLSKTKVYTSQCIELTLRLEYDKNDSIIKTDFEELIIKGFWIKFLEESKVIKKDNKFFKDFKYLIFPQQSGELIIKPQMINIAKREEKTNQIIWSKLYTKATYVNVLPLPNNINIQGNYTINAIINKTKTKINKPINLSLEIKGKGNIDDTKPFKINLQDQLIFSDKPTIQTDYKDNTYQGKFIQKFSIITNKDFILPSISFTYFNSDTLLIETIKTKPLSIIVTNKVKENNSFIKYIYALLGFILAFVYIFLYKYLKNKKIKNNLPISQKIKKAKNDKELYYILLTYKNNSKLKEIIDKLEQNIYYKKNHYIKKSDIMIVL